jgi:hypothetical protein
MKKFIVLGFICCIAVLVFYGYLKYSQTKVHQDADQIIPKETQHSNEISSSVSNKELKNLPHIWEKASGLLKKLGEPAYFSDGPSKFDLVLQQRREWIEEYNWSEYTLTVGYLPFYFHADNHYVTERAIAVGKEKKRVTSIDIVSFNQAESNKIQPIVDILLPEDATPRVAFKEVGEQKNNALRYSKVYKNQYTVYHSPSTPYEILVKEEREGIAGEEGLPSEIDLHVSLITEKEFESILYHMATAEEVTDKKSFDGTLIPSGEVKMVDMSKTNKIDFSSAVSKGCNEEKTLVDIIHAQDTSLLKICIESGANINADIQSSRPLMIAIETGNPLIVEELLKAGADPNLPNPAVTHYPLEQTIKQYREIENSKDIIHLLLQYGSNPQAVSEEGTTAVIRAKELRLNDIVDLMEKY